MAESIRVRIAPSPTGNLHVGTARTALFNELFARRHSGTFIVRIEDTDKARSQASFETNILEGLHWLGITWDEGPDKGGAYGPYRQSERTSHYEAAIKQLLAADKAYIDQQANGVIRLRVTPGTVQFTDMVRGDISTHSDSWGGDFVIARSLQDPLFHLAVVVDDAAMQISHVIRGEDHISNTARHILLQQALGLTTPHYAHLPLLLDEQRKKLSKRAGEVSLLAYRDQGYLPQTMVNYLALLGWNAKSDREHFTHEDLRAEFDMAGVQKGGAVFSLTKLQATNKHYLRQLTSAQLLKAARPFLAKEGITVDDEAYWQAALHAEQERSATLGELAAAVGFFVPTWQASYEPQLLIWRKSDQATTKTLLGQTIEFLRTLPAESFSLETLQAATVAWIEQQGLGKGDVLWPMRVALTGLEHSPGPFEVASVLGREVTLQRLAHAVSLL